MPNTAVFLTAPEVAEMLGVTRRTVVNLATVGALPVAQKLPGPRGAYLFDPTAVDAFIAEALTR